METKGLGFDGPASVAPWQTQPQPVMQTPANVGTPVKVHVINSQPTGKEVPSYRDWHDGLCSCGNNCGNCILTGLFYPCMLCHLYSRYDECCATPCIVPVSDVLLNVKHRSRNRIVGSIAGDCCTFCFCGLCALCRLYRDMEWVRMEKGSLH